MNSVTSCWMNLKFGLPPRCEMLSTVPVTKLSMPMTLWPRARRRSVRCEPRKPAAPVTTEVGREGSRNDFAMAIGRPFCIAIHDATCRSAVTRLIRNMSYLAGGSAERDAGEGFSARLLGLAPVPGRRGMRSLRFAEERGVYAASPFGWRARQNIPILAKVRTLKRRKRRAPNVPGSSRTLNAYQAGRLPYGGAATAPRAGLVETQARRRRSFCSGARTWRLPGQGRRRQNK